MQVNLMKAVIAVEGYDQLPKSFDTLVDLCLEKAYICSGEDEIGSSDVTAMVYSIISDYLVLMGIEGNYEVVFQPHLKVVRKFIGTLVEKGSINDEILLQNDKGYIHKSVTPYNRKQDVVDFAVSGQDGSEYGRYTTLEEAVREFCKRFTSLKYEEQMALIEAV